MTTFTPPRVTIETAPNIAGSEAALQHIADGLQEAETSISKDAMEALWDEEKGDYDESERSWERLIEEAAKEIAPSVAQMMEDAITKRLPWTNDR